MYEVFYHFEDYEVFVLEIPYYHVVGGAQMMTRQKARESWFPHLSAILPLKWQ